MRPIKYVLPAEADALANDVGASASRLLKSLLDRIKQGGASSALLEPEYVDVDFRNEFENFFVKRYERLPSRCRRIHFWAGDDYGGYISIRPLADRPVSRTMLAPDLLVNETIRGGISCLAPVVAQPYGEWFATSAFPFASQDGQYARCAHTTVWMLSLYHHLVNRRRRGYMSDIANAASRHEPARMTPSAGLSLDQTGAALQDLGLRVFLYHLSHNDGDHGRRQRTLPLSAIEFLVTTYLNSGVPLALCLPGHMRVLIGAYRRADGELVVIYHDESEGPYLEMTLTDLRPHEDWRTLIVALPGRNFLSAEAIDRIARLQFSKLLQEPEAEAWRWLGSPDDLVVRPYVTDSTVYKSRVRGREAPASVAPYYLRRDMPRWIWVAELYASEEEARRGPGQIVGELIIDASSAEENPRFIVGHIPGLLCEWTGPRVCEVTPLRDTTGEGAGYRGGSTLPV